MSPSQQCPAILGTGIQCTRPVHGATAHMFMWDDGEHPGVPAGSEQAVADLVARVLSRAFRVAAEELDVAIPAPEPEPEPDPRPRYEMRRDPQPDPDWNPPNKWFTTGKAEVGLPARLTSPDAPTEALPSQPDLTQAAPPPVQPAQPRSPYARPLQEGSDG